MINEKEKLKEEGLKTNSVQALQTTVNVTVSSEELTWLTNPSRHNETVKTQRQDSTSKLSENKQRQLKNKEETKVKHTSQEWSKLLKRWGQEGRNKKEREFNKRAEIKMESTQGWLKIQGLVLGRN